ncbi:hypothetical protein AB0E75_13820 [Streptomyces griseoviridis]|jgi:hypothetical protein|uniref:Uncharacterized protein n=3 Tax=Streptomyces TaxID=1883 RepID=A0ABT9LPG6_STRGD|nr:MULTISPECIES: hypothetical protein [Streptomyces]MDP9685431.1 hypothetical protein [Streptomyces griseoviridis]GGS33018.1 hypothetical protein GCM10010238_22900 [Streptomyces niveoruber]GGS87350.1 hypothetical protein GCM10010240_20940 [Streptomyces griseoviridis]GGU30590.1 hypothetical protein GCM10010259_21400 [Streptomyces daghestanicus]GHI32999.1 hypothetical protein Sdagh_47290 [Streptomyces daghestanicus]
MTNRRTSPYPVRHPARPGHRPPVGRSVRAGMLLAALAGLAWAGGMVWTVVGWTR